MLLLQDKHLRIAEALQVSLETIDEHSRVMYYIIEKPGMHGKIRDGQMRS